MTTQSLNDFEILDCSIRDGGYNNNWQFDKTFARETYRALSKSGVDFIEMGFRSSYKHFDSDLFGLWRFTTEDVLADTIHNIKGAKIALMSDFGKITHNDFCDRNDSLVELIRVAVHKNSLFKAIDLLEKIKGKGYKVSLQCMGYSTFSDQEKKSLYDALKSTHLDYVYVGDSYGSILPFQIKEIFEPLLEIESCKIGFHPHNNLQMAFANTIEALRTGVQIVDSTVYGIGRGAGNLPTEILLSFLHALGKERYNPVPVLRCIENFYLEQIRETPWGYQLPYMISGIFNSHPNYVKDLLRRKEFDMEDIWRAMGYIEEIAPVGFDAKIIGRMVEHGMIGKSSFKVANVSSASSTPSTPATYINRHVNRDFLVLANGPGLKKHKYDIQKFINKYDPIILGANFLNKLFIPHYHAFNHKQRFCSYVQTVPPDSKLLLGSNLPIQLIKEYTDRNYEILIFQDILDTQFGIDDGLILSNCSTISVLLIGVAIAMGAARVFIVGMDGYLHKDYVNSTLFYNEKFDVTEKDLNVDRHRWNEKFLFEIDHYLQIKGGEGIHILTPTSHVAFYKGLENYL